MLFNLGLFLPPENEPNVLFAPYESWLYPRRSNHVASLDH